MTMKRTCRDESGESEERVAEPEHDARKNKMPSRRLDVWLLSRLSSRDKHDLLNTTTVLGPSRTYDKIRWNKVEQPTEL